MELCCSMKCDKVERVMNNRRMDRSVCVCACGGASELMELGNIM